MSKFLLNLLGGILLLAIMAGMMWWMLDIYATHPAYQ